MIKQALNRIYWRFGGNGNTNPFPVNEKDIEAFNTLSDYVDKTQKEQFNSSELFAKMYIFVSQAMMESSGGTVLDNITRKRIGDILKKPLSQVFKEFTDYLNESEKYGFLSELKIPNKHPQLRTDQENETVSTTVKKIANSQELTDRLTKDVFSNEFVIESMTAEINNQINLHG